MACNLLEFAMFGWIEILLLLFIGSISYHAVVANYGPGLIAGGLDSLLAFTILMLLHCLLVMLLWSYFSVVFTDPGCVPPGWRPAVDEEQFDTLPLTMTEVPAYSENGRIQYCRMCNHLKPPRCNHCYVCGRCILKMDHHCAWVVNCVGALNYKYYLLFLFYAFLETSLVVLSLLPYYIALSSEGETPETPGIPATSAPAFGSNLVLALSSLGFLIKHILLVATNTTSLEAYEKKTTSKWQYDLGRKENFEQVFGMDKKYWFLPAYSKEDLSKIPALQGLEYPSRPDLDMQEL
ncbi:putative DHHC-type Zn-finger protein [Handroanthus impetiginosus]|uniref:S-acyltransferase n=1 Tax=Handroanthus impetiginosus TaxID=429701 RepID=A0A2G9I7P0_9LAMI|nr:putative DHHC-type Zn-finger protein [Handroanthus impetiginosus]